MESGESGPRPSSSQPTPHTSTTLGSESQARSPASERPLIWGERDPDEPMVFNPDEVLIWGDDNPEIEDGEQGCQFQKVSPATESLLKESFSKTVPNGTQQRWRQTFGMLACHATKHSKLYTILKAQIPKAGKDSDHPLARLQTFLLDVVGPLASLLEKQRKRHLLPEAAAETATQALHFLGNANTAISQESRRQVTDKSCPPDMHLDTCFEV